MRDMAGVAASRPMDDILDADLAVEDRALLAALPPALEPLVFFALGLDSLVGVAGVAKGAGEAVAEGAVSFALSLSLSAAFFLELFLGLGAGEATASFGGSPAEAAAASVTDVSAGFFFGFLGFASVAPSALGLAGFFGFEAAGLGVEPSAGIGEDPATRVGSCISILICAGTGCGCGICVVSEGPGGAEG